MHYKSLKLTFENFHNIIQNIVTLESNPVVAVAVSGGADSICLTSLLKNYIDTIGGKLVAVTVNHNLREDSLKEAEDVNNFLSDVGIEHHILNYNGPKPKSNIMEEARELRYNLLYKFCKENDIINLAIAHHFDDQIENFLIRLDRGSGTEGLSAMPTLIFNDGIRLIRPLLYFKKNEIYTYLNNKDINWIEDPTNINRKFKRNNIRVLIDNINPLDDINVDRLFKTSNHLLRSNFTINNLVSDFFSNHVVLSKVGVVRFNLTDFIVIDNELSLRVLSQILQTISSSTKPPRFEKLNNLHTALKSVDIDFKKSNLLGCTISRKDDIISVYRDHGLIENDRFHFDINNYFSIRWDNRFNINIGKLCDSNNKYFVTKLTEEIRLELKGLKANINGYPIDLLYTLPVIKAAVTNSNVETLEKIIAVPHINYYTNDILMNNISVEFLPSKPLTKVVRDI